jgi:hypothetical protein
MGVVVKYGKKRRVHDISEKMRHIDLYWALYMHDMGKGVEGFKHQNREEECECVEVFGL